MKSLAAAIPEIAKVLDVECCALYERQRALVRSGSLPAPIGRGRGSGAPATAENVALLTLAFLANMKTGDLSERARRFVGPTGVRVSA